MKKLLLIAIATVSFVGNIQPAQHTKLSQRTPEFYKGIVDVFKN